MPVDQTLNDGPWQHRVTVTATGQNDTQQAIFDPDLPTDIAVWELHDYRSGA